MTDVYPQSIQDSHEEIAARRGFPNLADMRKALDAQEAEIKLMSAELTELRKANPEDVVRQLNIYKMRVHNALEFLNAELMGPYTSARIQCAAKELKEAQQGR